MSVEAGEYGNSVYNVLLGEMLLQVEALWKESTAYEDDVRLCFDEELSKSVLCAVLCQWQHGQGERFMVVWVHVVVGSGTLAHVVGLVAIIVTVIDHKVVGHSWLEEARAWWQAGDYSIR